MPEIKVQTAHKGLILAKRQLRVFGNIVCIFYGVCMCLDEIFAYLHRCCPRDDMNSYRVLGCMAAINVFHTDGIALGFMTIIGCNPVTL